MVIGVDEAGRGALVGNVVAAAVLWSININLLGLTDSKKLSASQRFCLAKQIKNCSLGFAIGESTAKEVDELNVLQASLLAMQRAILKLQSLQSIRLESIRTFIDGNKVPSGIANAVAIVKGDAKLSAISAASVLAKVHRDEQMLALAKKYPEYGFESHKGYPTKKHLLVLSSLPIIPNLYRYTYKPVKKFLYK